MVHDLAADLAADLALARSLADQAAEVALPDVGAPLRWRHNADGSPVSEADLAVERAVVARLAAERPDDSVRLDAVLSEGGYPWDHAPGVVLLREAGGRFTDPLGGRRIDLHGGLYTNGRIHALLAATAGRAGDGPAPVP